MAAKRESTRERLLNTAERLLAERGVSVSLREIGAAAKQSNKSVVAYHFGTREDLVLAIARHHAPDVDRRRDEMLARIRDSDELPAWLECVVKPITDHLESLGEPTWYARFLANCVSDPGLQELIFNDGITSPSMNTAIAQLQARLPVLPDAVFETRGVMTMHVIVQTCADRERALQAGRPTPHGTWPQLCDAIIDALLGLWTAPVRKPLSNARRASAGGSVRSLTSRR